MFEKLSVSLTALGLLLSLAVGVTMAEEEAAVDAPQDAAPTITWMDDYAEAMDVANHHRKMLLIFFDDSTGDERCRRFASQALADPDVQRRMQDYVCARLPLETKITTGGKEIRLLDHTAFREMLGKPGIAILDFVHHDVELHGHVVSTFPLTRKLCYTPAEMLVILDLPRGTLTQRTLIYAVRTHPEHPKSTTGEAMSALLEEAQSHSQHQARIRVQGHHRWDSRFHRINAKLPPGLAAIEVCAESWPGENLVEAAVECVRSWRHSSGHWNAVRSRHRVYGYDMKRGRNGIWYATGIFGRG